MIVFHLIWGREKRYLNTKFDKWRANIVKDVILKDSTSSKIYGVTNAESIKNHWIGKPMRSEYHSLVHFYRLARTFRNTEDYIKSEAKLLDIGCASGRFLMFFSNNDKKGLELLSECIDYGAKSGINIVNGDAESLPFSDNEFDVSFLLEIIEHVQNPFKVMQEAKRVSQNRIICTFPYFAKTSIKPYNSKQLFQNNDHFLELEKVDFINMLTHLKIKGFEYEEINIWKELSFSSKILSLAIGYRWPMWHMFIIEK